jgi:hypothetical protein
MSKKAFNPRQLRPADLLRIVNAVDLPDADSLTEFQLRRHRNRAGYSISDPSNPQTVDLFRYAAWLTLESVKPKSGPLSYEEQKARQAERNAEAVRSAQDIGEIPGVVDPERKAQAIASFRGFCETYFAEVFYLSWSDDHLRVIEKIEKAVRTGGLFAMAMPRGSGKALALNTPLATPNGWTTMGDVKVGDTLFDERGRMCRVIHATEVMHDHPCYCVRFSDGEAIVCDADHLWTVEDRLSGEKPLTLTTQQMVDEMKLPGKRSRFERYRLPRVKPLQGCNENLQFDPQALSTVRYIVSIAPTESVPVRCIQVDSPSQLYLAGRKMVPTHNTVLCQTAVLWAALIGASPFICLVAASAERARDLLENIKIWLETNPQLHEDFPEVTYPIRCLERITNRQKGQKYQGVPTRIDWSSDRVVLPVIEGSLASGTVISSSGMKGSDIRGQNYARADGQVVRPQLVLVDDPQTTESAWSPSQSQRREAILAGDVLGMAGPGKKIAGLMACTVIRPADMADNILDRDKHPEWQGERTKMVYAFPNASADKLWARYTEIRADSLRNDGDGSQATEFYRDNREAMDAGSIVAWPQRHNDDELSAIQHAMNLRLRDEAAFFAEYQNEPIIESVGEEMLTADAIAAKTNGHPQSIIPLACNHMTMFIDVQQKVLFWMLCAWEENFTGYIIDYGTWPEQKRAYFTLRDIRSTISRAAPGAGLEGQIYAGLDMLTAEKLASVYRRDDGAEMRIDRCLIDANWGQSTDVVYQFCRQSQHAGLLLPSHGRYVGASSIPFSEYRRKRGDRVGLHWRIPNTVGKRQVRHALIDTNYWKTFVHARLSVAMGDPSCLSLYGRDDKAHRMLADHLTAEYRVKSMAQGRTVDEWKLRATRPDNHWLDCLVGCAVGASMQGVVLLGTDMKVSMNRKPMRLSDLQHSKW